MKRSRTDRLLGWALGVVLVLGAMSVALLGGRGADSPGAALSADGTRTVQVELGDMTITPSTVTVPAGTHLIFDVTNTDVVRHDLYIDGGLRTPLLARGQHARLDLGVASRDVEGWCTVPGHKAAGMIMNIHVTGGTHHAGAPEATATPRIDFAAKPGPAWTPYDPVLRPAPGGTEHRLTLSVRDTVTEVAPGVRQTLWTYNGTAPGPILHGHVGDLFTVTVVNDGDMDHSIDFHAGSLAPDGPMRPIAPRGSLTYQFVAKYSGAWLYHCSTTPMSLHIANGMYGAVIIDPPGLDDVAKQFVLIQSELYLGPQAGVADSAKIAARTPDAVVFNGYVNQYLDEPIAVRAGERIRVWVVDAGPQFGTSFHVVGAQFDTVFKEGAYLLRPGNEEHGAAQTLSLAPAQGGFVEFVLPEPGHYPFLDHAMVFAEHGAHGVFRAR
jgi:nitrite reductase (NO-forming)